MRCKRNGPIEANDRCHDEVSGSSVLSVIRQMDKIAHGGMKHTVTVSHVIFRAKKNRWEIPRKASLRVKIVLGFRNLTLMLGVKRKNEPKNK
jgi:hypothetical protein